jgi:hypothetical protein
MVLQPRTAVVEQGRAKGGPDLMCGAGRFTALRTRRDARLCEQPATEAVIIVTIRRASGAILRAGLCHQGANLPGRCGERIAMMVRLMSRHLRDQKFKIVGHTLPLSCMACAAGTSAPMGMQLYRGCIEA